jgi:phosphoribosylformylglycinamidine cyclo-ligase
MPESWDYRKAGLNLEKYAETMSGIQDSLTRTWDARVLKPPFKGAGGKGGSFASLFDLDPDNTGGLFAKLFRSRVRTVSVRS